MYVELLAQRNWLGLAEALSERFGVGIDARWLEAYHADELAGYPHGRQSKTKGTNESDVCLLVYFKNRLAQAGFFTVEHVDAPNISLPITLHTGFLWLIETPEMLERLPEPPEKEESKQIARSKLFHTHLVPHPIDRVAGRVGGLPCDSRLNRREP